MANYYTNVSFVMDVKTSENQARAVTILAHLEKFADDRDYSLPSELHELFKSMELEDFSGVPFNVSAEGATGLWFHNDEDFDVDKAVTFIQHLITTLDLPPVGFEWANDCDKARVGAFGGGAVFVTREEIRWTNTSQWLSDQTKL